ncbi:hypothetical protein [Nocardiopsis composta]|uniref:Uncharacterized protein n=1 Tax=Nocardiopsis composta TaxID=157465 RepID=A0A7W8VDR0_9ACTN|nr:hypothetical protein [Nocardiopsis composta]MBB5432507.1 hypothetical protein [Nocardiopsis composta]
MTHPRQVRSWSSATGIDAGRLDLVWRAFVRRFDPEHAFGLFKLDRPACTHPGPPRGR